MNRGSQMMSSPRTRGCSHARQERPPWESVFPAHAGVFPDNRCRVAGERRLPRARGGVPGLGVPVYKAAPSSPRTRGCSHGTHTPLVTLSVFPAHAGVFPCWSSGASSGICLPRARGGVPASFVMNVSYSSSSPRTRGCSRTIFRIVRVDQVFPAHAGVFPRSALTSPRQTGLPRARGGVPTRSIHAGGVQPSSPRTRGCSRAIS